VNDAGQVTGYSYTITAAGYAAYRAFIITPNDTDVDGFGDEWYVNGGGSVNTLMVDIGTLGGTNSWGRDINNLGHIVGESGVDDAAGRHYTRGFVWANGSMVDMGSLRTDPTQGFGTASAINDAGQVVGWADNDSSERRAVIWENGTLQDLNDLIYPLDANGNRVVPGILLSEARDINQDGVIVGWGPVRGSTGGETRGFMLRPILVDPSTLPEDDPNTTGGAGFDTTDRNLNLLGIFGLPSHLAGGSGDPNAPTTTLPAAGLCGATSTLMITLTLAGLVWTRRSSRHG
jgi:probable HAF family extracellular repeat protein